MNKIVLICIILMCLQIASCDGNVEKANCGTINNVNISIDNPTRFSEEEIMEAMNCVKEAFQKNFYGCILTDLRCGEHQFNTDPYINSHLYNALSRDNPRNSLKSVTAENVIVLMSDFDAGATCENELNAGSTYKNFKWILIRYQKADDWIIDDCGLG